MAIWLYFPFALSYRDVEDMLAERGIDVSYETVRRWASKFGAIIARKLDEDGLAGISTKCLSPSTADDPTSGVPWTAKARSWTSWFSRGEPPGGAQADARALKKHGVAPAAIVTTSSDPTALRCANFIAQRRDTGRSRYRNIRGSANDG